MSCPPVILNNTWPYRGNRGRGVRLASMILLAVLLVVLLCMPRTAAAALLDVQTAEQGLQIPLGFGLRTGFMYSDNITRVPEDGEDELIGVVELVSNWQYQGARSEAIVAGNIAYRNYTRGEFDNEFRGNLFLGGLFEIVPENISWRLTNHFANAAINPLVPGGPENTQYYNVIETGPQFVMRPGNRNEIELSVARADVQAEVSEIDHERDTVFARWNYDLGSTSAVSINASSQAISFDDDVDDVDFDKEEAFLAFERQGSSSNFSMAAGRARTELDDGESRNTTVGWLRWNGRRTSNSRVYANLSRQAGDTSSMMSGNLLRPASIWRMIAVGDPYTSTLGYLSYVRGVRGHAWSAVASVQRLDYMVSPIDQEQRGLRLNADMMLTSNLLLALSAGHVRIDYTDQQREDRLSELSAEFDYRLDRNWSLVSGARYVDGDSDDPRFMFRETFLTLFINYTPGGRAPLGRPL